MSGLASVLGCGVDLMDRRTVLATIDHARDGNHLIHVVTLNPEQIMAARSNESVRALLASADLTTIDGVGLEMALRLQGRSGFNRVTGVSLLEAICANEWPVFLLGGRPGAAETAKERLQARFPGAQIVGAWSGGTPSFADDSQTMRRITAAQPELVLVAYGAPAQSAWIERNRRALEQSGVRVAIGVGGALDFASGLAKPAPALASRLGAEWLVRLVREPWRWRRQLVLPVFAALAFGEAIGVRRSAK